MLKDGATIEQGGVALARVDSVIIPAAPNLHIINSEAPIVALGNLATAATEKIPVSHLGGTALGRRSEREFPTPARGPEGVSAHLLEVQSRIGALKVGRQSARLNERTAFNNELAVLRELEEKILIEYGQVAAGQSAYYRQVPDASRPTAPFLAFRNI